jgi:hypothetical protein
MKKMIFAIVAAPAAMPVNPNTAAIIAIIRNVTVQRNIVKCFIGDSTNSILKIQKTCQTTFEELLIPIFTTVSITIAQ